MVIVDLVSCERPWAAGIGQDVIVVVQRFAVPLGLGLQNPQAAQDGGVFASCDWVFSSADQQSSRAADETLEELVVRSGDGND